MFDLEKSITDWRASATRHDSINVDTAEELESHLREQTAELSKNSDLTDEEAFLVASRRLGTFAELATEFGHANPGRVWMARLFWFIFGYLILTALLDFVGTVSNGASLIAIFLGAGGATPILTLVIHIAMFVGLIALIVGVWRSIFRHGLKGAEEAIARHPVRTALVVLGVIGLQKAIGIGTGMVLLQNVGVQVYSQSAVFLSYYRFASTFILFVGLATTLAFLGNRLRRSASPAI